MPNWCSNEVVLKHKDPAVIERAAAAFQLGKFLQEFIPCPENLYEDGSWYDFCVRNWGTKWDIGGDGEYIEQVDANTLELRFDSAWSPPIEGYGRLLELGFEIEAFYNEPGMAFCGSYTGAGNEEFDDCIDYSGWDAETVREEMPDLDTRFGISDYLEEVQSEQQEE